MSSLSIDAQQLDIANWKASVTLTEITGNVNSKPTQEATFCSLSGRLETQSCENTTLATHLPVSQSSMDSQPVNARRTTDMMLDSQSLQEIKLIDDQDLALRQVAEQFEAIFVQQMLKQMRSASAVIADKDNPLTSQSDSVYQDMLDSQLALNMSQTSGMGIADMLVKQLSRA